MSTFWDQIVCELGLHVCTFSHVCTQVQDAKGKKCIKCECRSVKENQCWHLYKHDNYPSNSEGEAFFLFFFQYQICYLRAKTKLGIFCKIKIFTILRNLKKIALSTKTINQLKHRCNLEFRCRTTAPTILIIQFIILKTLR